MFAEYRVKALSRLFYVCTYIDCQLNHLCRYSVQITHNLNSTHVSHVCNMHVQKQKHVWHQTICLHACKINSPLTHSHTHLSIRSICHETILLTTSSALSFIINACRTILGGIVNDILGHPRHTAFVAS